MKRIIFTTVLSFALAASIMAQNKIWSLDDCMRYAVENSPKVKQQLYTNNTYKAEHQSAIASFFAFDKYTSRRAVPIRTLCRPGNEYLCKHFHL